MSLKIKLLLILILITIPAIFSNYIIIEKVIQPSFNSLQYEEAEKDLYRIVESIQQDIENIDTFAHDWANWLNTYEFIDNKNIAYIESSLGLNSFTDNNMNLIHYYNIKGELVWGGIRDLDDESKITLKNFSGDLPPNHILFSYDKSLDLSLAVVKGIFTTEAGFLLLSSRPILNGDNKGPIKGTLVMGRFITDEMISDIIARVKVSFEIVPLDQFKNNSSNLTKQVLAGRDHIFGNDDIDNLYGYFILKDIFGKTAFIIKTTTLKTISKKGAIILRYASLATILMGIIVFFILLITLNNTIIKPITILTNHIKKFSNNKKFDTSLVIDSDDEFGTLGNEFNRMAEVLQNTQYSLLEQSYESGLSEMASEILHEMRNLLTPVVSSVDLMKFKLNDIPMENFARSIEELKSEDIDPKHRKYIEQYLFLLSKKIVEVFNDTNKKIDMINLSLFEIEKTLNKKEILTKTEKLFEKLSISQIIVDSLKSAKKITSLVEVIVADDIKEYPEIFSQKITLNRIMKMILNCSASSLDTMVNSYIKISAEIINTDKEYVKISIVANGLGIEKEDLEQVFDRNFTLKYSKKSLHWCSNILIALGSSILCESEGINMGTTFHILLPTNKSNLEENFEN